MFIGDTVCTFTFLLYHWLWYQSNAGIIKSIRKCSLPLKFFGKAWKYWEFFKCLVEFTNEAIRCRFSLLGDFELLIESYQLYRSLQIFLFLYDLILVGIMFLRICPFEAIQFVGVQLFIVLSSNPFYFCMIPSDVPTFISEFSNLAFFHS